MTTASVAQRGQPISERLLERKWPISLVFTTLLVLIWQAFGWAGLLPTYVESPAGVIAGIRDLISAGELDDLLIPSLKRAAIGFAIGASLGVLVGLIAGTWSSVGDVLELPVSFTYPLPKIALFPAFAILLGFTDTTRILVISLACFYPAYLNAFSGTRAIDQSFVDVARNIEASNVRTFTQVIFPAALPRIFVGLRICLALSFILLFSTEIIGFSNGIGSDILKSSRNGDYRRMYAGIAVLAICGFLASRLLLLIGKWATHGRIKGGVVDD